MPDRGLMADMVSHYFRTNF